jgi:hypothetical protein
MVLSSKDAGVFWTCGFAIMGYPVTVTCPPSTEMCNEATIDDLPDAETPSNIDVSTGSTVVSDAFFFPDSVSTFCGTSECSKTHSLQCIDCLTCKS